MVNCVGADYATWCWVLVVPPTCLAQLSTKTTWLYISMDLELHMGLTGIATGRPLGFTSLGNEPYTALHTVSPILVRRSTLGAMACKLVTAPLCL